MSEEFNGWTNRETWAVALHFDNNGELYKIKNKALANYPIQLKRKLLICLELIV